MSIMNEALCDGEQLNLMCSLPLFDMRLKERCCLKVQQGQPKLSIQVSFTS